ncbi:hypothetical protein C3920_15780 [Novacetimonas pomaceti]|uniref:Uncharacterized protein n=1 Tax=Novacetimonas pomaceti TaxID=2021998 RepID=A0ABX5P0G9_9PROT|nr:hypothetical protein C3920_15780 [Novacetimonas pomaceti]
MVILAINGLLTTNFLGARKRPERLQSIATFFELSPDVLQSSLKIKFECRDFTGVDISVGHTIKIFRFNPSIV